MARYTGPVTKKSRAFGQSLTGFDKSFEKKKRIFTYKNSKKVKWKFNKSGCFIKENILSRIKYHVNCTTEAFA